MRMPILSVLLAGGVSTLASAEVIYVNARATGGETGRSWEDAYTDLQAALNRAADRDEVWIASGTYTPTRDDDREASFRIASGVRLVGGFAGGELRIGDRDWDANPTILSGDIGVPANRLDNSYRIVVSIDVSEKTKLDGLILENAHNDAPYPTGRGGGIYNERSELQIANGMLRWNRAGGEVVYGTKTAISRLRTLLSWRIPIERFLTMEAA